MLFNSPVFLFLFLPLVLVINRFLKVKASNVFLLLCSLIFYFYGEALWIGILLLSIGWNYSFALLIDRAKKKKAVLSIAIAGNLAVLIYFKYTLFFANTLRLSKLHDFNFENIILPLGISFFKKSHILIGL